MCGHLKRDQVAAHSTPKCESLHAIQQGWWKYDEGTVMITRCVGLELAHRDDDQSLNFRVGTSLRLGERHRRALSPGTHSPADVPCHTLAQLLCPRLLDLSALSRPTTLPSLTHWQPSRALVRPSLTSVASHSLPFSRRSPLASYSLAHPLLSPTTLQLMGALFISFY
jgi:hypothetical protein